MSAVLPARNLAAAEKMGLDLVSPCAMCFNRLRFSQNMIKKKVFDTIEKLGHKVATTIEPQAKFFKAESYHQDYYQGKNSKPYCHSFKKLF